MYLDDIREFAIAAHNNQKYGEYPYSFHLDAVHEVAVKSVGANLIDAGVNETQLYAGAYLHDVLEDTDHTVDSLMNALGRDRLIAEVIDAVWRCSADGGSRKERQKVIAKKIRGHPLATTIKLCDRVANIQSCQKTNSRLLRMYQKEKLTFRELAYKPGVCDRFWDYLDCIY